LDDKLTEVKVWPYKVKGKGSATVVTQSSHWLPGRSVVPGTIEPPICIMVRPAQGIGVGVGVTVDVGDGLAVGVGVGDGNGTIPGA
jgi:hypothetical protein